jgi:hypothetical protein
MTIKSFFFIFIAAILAWVIPACGYEVGTHTTMAAYAAQDSILSKLSTLKQLGLKGVDLYDESQKFPNSDTLLGFGVSNLMTISALIQHGAAFEDNRRDIQALYHFFNPVNGQGLTVDGWMPGAPSPNWALEDIQDFSTDQPFSYKKGRQYFYDALTKPDKAERGKNWGLTFQTLGHVIHHLQHMAQPQHVRNEPHCDGLICAFPGYFLGLWNPSLYEKWTLRNPPANMWFTTYAPVYSADDTGNFTTPRQFWTTTEGNGTRGNGIAEYTNRGFFSSGTLFSSEALPSPTLSSLMKGQPLDVVTVCAEAEAQGRPPCPPAISGEITFFANTVTDSLRPSETRDNPRAASYSLFDPELEKKGVAPVFALNRFDLDSAHEFLIPRAVAYSAGLINYFFRGKMEISLPDEGVYGVVDHSVEKAKNTDGFRKIKLKLRNVTPAVTGVEPMGAPGKLQAVAKFHRNSCYQPDLSGEYGAEDENNARINDWKQCRSKQEDIVVSEETDVPAGINADAQPVTFLFPTPIPINATDLYLQVVYRGPLGQEEDAVAVATKDIAEPDFQIGSYNTMEQYLWGGLPFGLYPFKQYYCDQILKVDYDTCKYRYRFSAYFRFVPPTNFDPANPVETYAATAAIEGVLVSRYGRLAVLTDPGSFSAYWMKIFPEGYPAGSTPDLSSEPSLHTYTYTATINQLDPETNTMDSTPYREKRGIYGAQAIYETLSDTNLSEPPPLINPLDPVPARVNY